MIKVFGHPASTCTQRILATLIEKQVPYEIIVVSLQNGEHKQPAHLARQPFGQLPAIEDTSNGVKMFESRAICRYISKQYATGTDLLLSKDVVKNGLVETWQSVEQANFDPAISKIVSETIFKKWRGQAADENIVKEQREAVASKLDVYNTVLSKQDYLAGNEFSLADLFHLPYGTLLFAGGNGDLITSRPHLNAWWTRISKRESWEKTLALTKQ